MITVGINDANVTNSDISGVGAVVGWNADGKMHTSYATVKVNVIGPGESGGLVGLDEGTVTDAYWDMNTTKEESTSGDGTGLTTTEMKGDAAQRNMDGFDFTNTWDVSFNIVETGDEKEVSYPFLRDNKQTPSPGLQLVSTDPFFNITIDSLNSTVTEDG